MISCETILPCFPDVPIVATSPHFYARNFSNAHKITGMIPDREKQHSYAIVDPSFGIPLDQCARTQTNLAIPELTGYSADIKRFSDMIIPMFWIEYVRLSDSALTEMSEK